MHQAVFISDIHLHPQQPEITQRFLNFLEWARENTQAIYILGDFFHVWAGDDTREEWTNTIATQLANLSASGVRLYYMHGNRDFLLGSTFLQQASMTLLPDPYVLDLGDNLVLITHGDQYCTQDRSHQWLRKLTRNRLFPKLFLRIPPQLRLKLVNQVRHHSEYNKSKIPAKMAVVCSAMFSQMQQMKVNTVIHGHIHQPGLTTHPIGNQHYMQYVLSDWDDTPQLLCYNKTKGFYFFRK